MNSLNSLIDCLKGFAILLVVLGHSIQFNSAHFDENILFRIIYSFHMPLLMFLSGFIGSITFDGSFKKLNKRFNSLVLPFFAWFFFSLFFSKCMYFFKCGQNPDVVISIINLIKSPEYGLWYLWILFLDYIVLYISLKISSQKEVVAMLAIWVVINIVVRYFPHADYLGFGLLSRYLFFFLLGYAVNKHSANLGRSMKIVGIASLILYPLLVPFWSRISQPSFCEYLLIAGKIKTIILLLYSYSVPIFGIFSAYTIFKWLLRSQSPVKTVFSYFGKKTLAIYAIHFHFIKFVFLISSLSFVSRVFLTWSIALAGSIVIQFCLKKSKLASLVFLGRSNA